MQFSPSTVSLGKLETGDEFDPCFVVRRKHLGAESEEL